MASRIPLSQRLLPYLYIGPALTVACVFSFVSMGISLWVSFHHYDAFAGAALSAERRVPVVQTGHQVFGHFQGGFDQ